MTIILLLTTGQVDASDVATASVDFRDYLLEVASSHGNPSPPVGVSIYAWRATVSCVAGAEPGYVCTGWAGTGAVPTSGTETATGPVILEQPNSSIAWEWEAAEDSDGDGIADQWELDNFGDLTTADASTDTDGDGVSDLDEFLGGTDPNVENAEGSIAAVDFRDYTLEVISAHGAPNPAVGVHEYAWRFTVTSTAGTEGGYTSNGWTGTGSIPATGTESTTGPITLDELNSSITWEWSVPNDDDGDGLSNEEEAAIGTNPNLADTDGDGLLDGEEVNIYNTNPLLSDTDGDMLGDGFEVSNAHLGADPTLDQTALFAEWADAVRNSPAAQATYGLYSESAIRNVDARALLISVDTETGQVILDFELQWTDDLNNPDWRPLDSFRYIDSNIGDKSFYRVFIDD